jgi:hypothetical protein
MFKGAERRAYTLVAVFLPARETRWNEKDFHHLVGVNRAT